MTKRIKFKLRLTHKRTNERPIIIFFKKDYIPKIKIINNIKSKNL